MTNYRRSRIEGGTYFFTVALAIRSSTLLTDRIDVLGAAFRYAQVRHPFASEAVVVPPDHLHALWILPPGDEDYSTRWRLIKTEFSRAIPAGEDRTASREARGERGVWQRRYWEHLIRDDADFARHVEYIHYNPVKHGHAQRVAEWQHSSFHRYVRSGILPVDWGAGVPFAQGGFGES